VDINVVIGAALVCAAGGILPWINSELALVGAALLLPRPALLVLVLACAMGQMVAKLALYGATCWAPHRLPARARVGLARAEKYRDRPRLMGAAVFTGALVSVPPFYLVTLACGVLRIPLALFALAGTAGTVVRYGALAWAGAALGTN